MQAKDVTGRLRANFGPGPIFIPETLYENE